MQIPEGALSSDQQMKFANAFFEAQRLKSIDKMDEAVLYFEKCLQLDSTNATVNYELGNFYFESNDFEKATAYIQKAIEGDPTNVWYLRTLWQLSKKSFNRTGELQTLRKLRQLDPGNPEFLWEKAMAHLFMNQPDSAIADLTALEEMMGTSEVITMQKVHIYMQSGDFMAAENELRKNVDGTSHTIPIRNSLAKFYADMGRFDEAIGEYNAILAIHPKDPQANLSVGQLLVEQNQLDSAQAYLVTAFESSEIEAKLKLDALHSLIVQVMQKPTYFESVSELADLLVEVHPNDPEVYRNRSELYQVEYKYPEAIDMLRKSLNLPEGDHQAYWNKLLLLEFDLRKWDELGDDASNAIDRYPNLAFGYYFKGISLSATRSFDDAIEVLEEGLLYALTDPKMQVQIQLELASTYAKAGEHRDSDDAFEELLNDWPENATILNNYAYYLSFRKDKLPYAKQLIERSIELAPHEANNRDTYAWILYQLGEDEKALQQIDVAIAQGGDKQPDILEHKGDILGAMGRNAEAVVAWEKALSAGGNQNRIREKINAVQ